MRTVVDTLTAAERREHAREYVLCYGDQGLWSVVLDALDRVPGVVLDHVIANVAFIMVGRDARAWTSSARLLDREGQGRDRVIVLGPDADVEVVLHEISHTLRACLDPHVSAIPCVGEIGLHEHLARVGLQPWAADETAAEEARADADASRWLSTSDKVRT